MQFSPFPSRALIQSAVSLALLLVFMPNASHAAAACTHYASPNGTGNGSSASQPFQIANFWAVAGPGKTLCLADGTYTGDSSMIQPPLGLSGTALAPITIAALNDGKVHINGQSARKPVGLNNNDWFVLEGFNASDSHLSVVGIGGGAANNIIRRVCAWNANSTKNVRVFGITGSGHSNTIEDSCGFGGGRAIVQISQGGNNTTIRRFWGVYEADTSLTGPESVFQFAYNGTAHTLENVIGTWKQTSAVNPKSIFNLNNEGADHRILGSMAYARAGDTMSASSLFSTDWAGVPHGPVTIRDVVLYTEQSKKPWSLASGGSPCTNCSLHSITAIGGAPSTIGASWSQTNRGDYASISSMNATSANPFQATGGTGARMCFRYVNGVLTSTKLWPWPMDQRIRTALDLAGKNPDAIFGGAGKTLTDLIESMFGTIPSSCKTSTFTSVGNVPSIPTAASNLKVSY